MDDVTRRTFIAGGAGAVALLAVGGTAKYAFGSDQMLRPPGGQNEDTLIANCIKCDRCWTVCPLKCVVPANMNDGLLNSRTPKLDFHKGYCDFCVDANDGKPLCRANCPTGALGSFDPDTEWIGAAVLDTELCLAYGVARSCMRCIEGCPFDAIVADEYGRPVVDTEKCNGCGYCEFICPSNTYRTYSGSTKRAIVVEPSEISRTEFVEGNPIEAKGGQA